MKLFMPIKIGNKEIKNRLVMAPMTTHFADSGYVTERMVNFYEARAKGGVGLVTVEDAIVDYPIGNNTDNPLSIDHDKYIPMLKKLSHTIRKHGAVAMLQLSHAGRRAGQISNRTNCLERTGGHLPVAPSPLAHPSPGHVAPRPLSIEEIQKIIEKFVQAAKRAAEADFEMISLHCAHMYLCGQFLSPWSNKRRDIYGGSFENRLRFPLKIIQRIKQELGEDFPIVIRMNGQEPEHGNSPGKLQKIASRFERAGVNALHVSVGFGSPLWDKNFIPAEATMGMPEGCIVGLAENIKKAVSIPVIAVNKIRHVPFAESVLQKGRADMIALGRSLLADPDWPKKAMDHREKEIRPCISCCQGCVANIEKGKPITCLVNPLLGKEKEYILTPVAKEDAKKILVIGGGPAGLEFSITAAKRGHRVILWEKDSRLGGKLTLAAIPPWKGEINEFTEYLRYSVARLGIEVAIDTDPDMKSVKALNPDAVVLATGGKTMMPDLEGNVKGNIITGRTALTDSSVAGQRVIIIGGGLVGLEIAKYLIELGRSITIIERLSTVGTNDMPSLVKIPLLLGLQEKGAQIFTEAIARRITKEGIEVEHEGLKKFIPGDTIITCLGTKPVRNLQGELKDIFPKIYTIGDCHTAGNMLSAIHDGFITGLTI